MKRIELDAPNIGRAEKTRLNQALDKGFVSTYGPFVAELENKFVKYLKAGSAVSLQSGTAALQMSLYELGIKNSDEVIVPAFTFIATVNPVVYVGAKPVFVDVDKDTWNISPEAIKKNITKKTKAIIPVHIYGSPCDMGQIMEIAKKHNLYVIEDAAESLGATYRNRFTGTFGDFGCFSFNGNKIITTGGGGMITGNDRERIAHLKFLVNQSRCDVAGGYYHPEIGFNFRMTNIEAALGLAQMSRLNKFLAKKRKFHRIYMEELGRTKSISFQGEYQGAQSSCWLSCIAFKEKIDITKLQDKLKRKGIPTRRVFMPVVEFPPYKKYKSGNYKNSYEIYDRGLCLPGSTLNSENNVYYVSKTIKKLIG